MAILKVANIHFDTAGTTLIRANGANTLTFNTAGAEDVRIDPAGNVLIGRTNSTVGNNVKLDVAGGINASAVLVNGAPALTGNITSNVVISVADNNNAALRITQTGTGDAIRVEDDANTDSTPFVVDANGNVGIGTSLPSYKLLVRTPALGADGVAAAGPVGFTALLPSTAGGNFNPLVSANDQSIIFYGGSSGAGSGTGNLIIAPWSTSSVGMKIDYNGNVLIGRTNSTVGNNVKLDVNGAINASAVLVNGQSVIAIFDGANTITNAAFTQANTARTQANTAFLGANAALIQANTARDQGNTAFLGANAALIQANTARDQGNTAFLGANAALIQANTARDQGNTAFLGANAALIQANTARDQANTAFLGANAALIQANTARDQGNTAFLGANAALIQANTARNQANDAYTQANSAFLRANSTTYTSNIVISVADNTNAALRITQTGTGDAIRVEDSANPDSTPFIVDASGQVGIGTSSPATLLHLAVTAAPTGTTQTFSRLTAGNAFGADFGGGLIQGVGSIATISTVNNGVATERIRIVDPSGNVLIGRTDSTVGLGVKLDVNGAINASAIYVNGAAQQSGAATYSANVGNNSANTFNVSHSLNKQFVIPAVRENSTGYYVYPDIKYTSVNTIVLEFVNAPTTNQYTVIVLG